MIGLEVGLGKVEVKGAKEGTATATAMEMRVDPADPLKPRKWALTEVKAIIARWQTFLREEGFWNRYVHVHDTFFFIS